MIFFRRRWIGKENSFTIHHELFRAVEFQRSSFVFWCEGPGCICGIGELEPRESGDGNFEVAAFPLAETAVWLFSRHVEEDGEIGVVGVLGFGGFPALGLLSLMWLHVLEC